MCAVICNAMLIINAIVMRPSIIFWVLWDLPPWQWSHSHPHSRSTIAHDISSITAENTNIHGSSQCGTMCMWAASGAISPMTDSTIGRPQQNMCGTIDAIIPIFTALFFMFPLMCLVRMLASPAGLEPASNS